MILLLGIKFSLLKHNISTYMYNKIILYLDWSIYPQESHVDSYSLEDIKSQLGMWKKQLMIILEKISYM